jgi:hypothetical protein
MDLRKAWPKTAGTGDFASEFLADGNRPEVRCLGLGVLVDFLLRAGKIEIDAGEIRLVPGHG